jgi:hypothetical protein
LLNLGLMATNPFLYSISSFAWASIYLCPLANDIGSTNL